MVRVDTGVRAGDEISQFYDPMIAKLIVWGEDRREALRRLARALEQYRIVGVTTNVAFLQRLIAHRAFAEAELDTGLIARHHAELFPPAEPPSAVALAIAAVAELVRLRREAATRASSSSDPYSPWHAIDPWWLNASEFAMVIRFVAHDTEYPVSIAPVAATDDRLLVDAGGKRMTVTVTGDDAMPPGEVLGTVDDVHFDAYIVVDGDQRYLFRAGGVDRLRVWTRSHTPTRIRRMPAVISVRRCRARLSPYR